MPMILDDCPDVRAREVFQFAFGHASRIAHDAALSAAERQIDDGGLPGHPAGKRTDRVDRLVGMKADASFRRPAGKVVLNRDTRERFSPFRCPS